MPLLNFLRQFHHLPDDDYELLTAQFERKQYKKGTVLTRPGQIQRHLLFINKGVQISYFDTGEKQHVVAFTYPPGFTGIPDSFSTQTPSKYYLECLTDSEFDQIGYAGLQKLFDRSQQIERLFRKAMEAILAGVISRHIELHTLTIEERFKAFAERSPHLFQLVPHKHIASYLNIDPTNFSKLYNKVRI